VKPSSATTSPSRTMVSTASLSLTIIGRRRTRKLPASAAPSEGEGMGYALHRDTAQLRELVHDGRAAEPAETAVLDAAERHLRLVADGLVVDVDDPGVDQLRKREATVDVLRDDPRREPVGRRVCTLHGLICVVDDHHAERRPWLRACAADRRRD